MCNRLLECACMICPGSVHYSQFLEIPTGNIRAGSCLAVLFERGCRGYQAVFLP